MNIKLKFGLAVPILLILMSPLAGQQGVAASPGRIQLTFDGLNRRAAGVNEITLDGAMLQLGIRMLSTSESDAQARAVLSRLKGVYIKSFRFEGEGRYSDSDLASVRRQLDGPGWAHIMSVHSRPDRQDVDVFVMSDGKGVEGMAIIVACPTELRVVNLVGPVDPAELSRLGGHFGIPQVEAETGRKDRNRQ
ncbi:MAG TPA: DUF4252 domain-containing protein [Terriglobales bacterium]